MISNVLRLSAFADLLNFAGGDDFSSLTKEAFASKLADTLADREVLLKICAMNLYEIEENSRPERLADYKQAFKESLEIFCGCLRQFFPTTHRMIEIRSGTLSFPFCMAFILMLIQR